MTSAGFSRSENGGAPQHEISVALVPDQLPSCSSQAAGCKRPEPGQSAARLRKKTEAAAAKQPSFSKRVWSSA